MTIAIKIENVSKLYRLGTVGTGTIVHDLNRWWHQIRGKEDPYAKIGQVNDRTKRASSDEKREASSDFATPSSHSSLATSDSYVWALRDINLEVQQGEVVGIIGRNGAGKSTLLKLLSRVTAPTSGSIKAKGRIASLLEVGTGFHPDLTGRENIYLNGAILGMKSQEISKQLDEIVAFSGCAKYLDTPVKRYSSGMTVRLGFAVAAHLKCEILIVDEVLAVGDAEFQKKCLSKMSEVAGLGRTVIFVSHSMHSVAKLCQKTLLMESGTIRYHGPTDQIVRQYLSEQFAFESPSTIPPAGADAFAEFNDVQIEDENGSQCSNIAYGAPWQVKASFTVRRPISHFVVGLGLCTDDDIAVRTSWTTPIDIEPGDYYALFRENTITLAPRMYRLAVGLSEHHRNIHYVPEAARLSIIRARAQHQNEAYVVSDIHGIISNEMVVSVVRSTSLG